MSTFAPPPTVPPPPPPPGARDTFAARMAKLHHLAGVHEIREDWVEKLRQLEQFDVVCILDDSGSMGSIVTVPGQNAYSSRTTRWDELKHTASIIVELVTAVTEHGVDCYFLNRPPVMGVTQAAQIQAAFDFAPPAGFTPLTRCVQQVLGAKAAQGSGTTERDLLIIIATDGEPTNDQNRPDVQSFIRALKQKGQRTFVQISAFCSRTRIRRCAARK